MVIVAPHYRRRIRARLCALTALLLPLILVAGCATESVSLAQRPTAEDWLLRVVNDEESIEKRIASYFRDQYDVEAEFLFIEEHDLYLQYQFSSDNGDFPDMAVFIDSQPSATNEVDGETKVVERRVTVTAYYVLSEDIKTPEVRRMLLEQINQWHIGRWVPQRIYLDDDGDIVLESAFNIPGDGYPVHAEIVGDQILRMNAAWQEFYRSLAAVIGDPDPDYAKAARIALSH